MATIGFTCSTFDLLHAGHVLMLQEAKEQCDYLIVGLQVDPSIDRPEKNSPVQSLLERQLQLKAVRYVDEIVVYQTEDDLRQILGTLPIAIRIIGEEYRNRDFTGRQLCRDLGIEIYFNRRSHSLSSSELRERVKNTSKKVS